MYKLLFIICFTFTNSYIAIAQDAYDPDFLAVKKIFAYIEKQELTPVT